MKHILFGFLTYLCLYAHAQVAVNLPPGQPIDPLAAFQVHGTARIDTIPDASIPTHILVLDQHDSIIHKVSFYDFISYIQLNSPIPKVHVYTTDAVWTKPPGLKYIVVEMVGGGGGGGGCYNYGGGAGAAGGYCKKIINETELGATEIITIGIGGHGGTPQSRGENGETSSFGIHCSASGGEGGNAQTSIISATDGSSGGVGVNGDINLHGNNSGGATGSGQPLYCGASSFFGAGAVSVASNSSRDGYSATGFGSGGSGGNGYSSVNKNGGDGSSGILIITEFF